MLDPRRLPLRPWRFLFRDGDLPAAETVFTQTRDHVQLALHRLRPVGQPRASVMLLHGLGGNRYGYLHPRRSLAVWLSQRGYDCFVPELRGAGRSGTRNWRWDLDDYLRWDLPALLSAIREITGRKSVHWVGHSMGGLLLLCYLVRSADRDIQSGVTIGSALDYTAGDSAFRRLFAKRALIEKLPLVPMGPLMHLLAPALMRWPTRVERFNFWPSNIEPAIVRSVYAHYFEWIPITLLKSLGTTFEPGGLCSRDGMTRYLECAKSLSTPLRFLVASRDVQCPAAAVEATARAIGEGKVDIVRFGREHGHADDYGHFDLVLGKRAPDEVWPRIAEWLERPASQ